MGRQLKEAKEIKLIINGNIMVIRL